MDWHELQTFFQFECNCESSMHYGIISETVLLQVLHDLYVLVFYIWISTDSHGKQYSIIIYVKHFIVSQIHIYVKHCIVSHINYTCFTYVHILKLALMRLTEVGNPWVDRVCRVVFKQKYNQNYKHTSKWNMPKP